VALNISQPAKQVIAIATSTIIRNIRLLSLSGFTMTLVSLQQRRQ